MASSVSSTNGEAKEVTELAVEVSGKKPEIPTCVGMSTRRTFVEKTEAMDTSSTNWDIDIDTGNSTRTGEPAKDAEPDQGGHCLCGSSEESSFMICCDYCSVWYHGSCLQVTRALANRIEKYACPQCSSKDENCKIIYRVMRKEKYDSTKDSSLEKETAKRAKEERDTKSASCSDLRKSSKDEYETSAMTERCEKCINCFRSTNCGKCGNCEANREPCLKRICVQSGWKKKSATSSSFLLGKQNEARGMPGRLRKEAYRSRTVTSATDDDEVSRCGSEKIISSTQDGLSAAALRGDSPNSLAAHTPEKGKRGRKKGWRKNKNTAAQEKSCGSRSPEKSSKRRDRSPSSDHSSSGRSHTLDLEERRQVASVVYDSYCRRRKNMESKTQKLVQCLGPECVKSARPGSKYCSDDCGMQLAKMRLQTILPGRVNDYWEELPRSAARSRQLIAPLEDRIQTLSNTARIFGDYEKEVYKWIEQIMDVEPSKDEETNSFDLDFVLYCVNCAMEYPAKHWMKHVERCFVRTERQCCYGTPNKSPMNPYNIFCDQFNKANSSYCKRLRMLCSEHYKPGPEANRKVCGYPFIWSRPECHGLHKMFSSPDDFVKEGFCKKPMKECQQHYNWVQNVLGLIEVEILQNLMKLDECFDKKRWLQLTEKLRGDVLSLMCNKTETASSRSEVENNEV